MVELSLRRIRATYFMLFGLFWFSTALLIPLYVLYLMQRGLSLAELGFWAGTNTLAVVLLELPTGGLADSWGRGRVFSTANLIIAVSLIMMVLIPGKSVLFVGAAVFGAGRALSSGSLDAWFVDSLKRCKPDIDIEKELGPSGAVVLTALAGGSLLGSILPMLIQGRMNLGPLPTMAAPLLADAGLKVVLAALTMILIREPGEHTSAFRAFTASLRKVPGTLLSIRKAHALTPGILRLLAGGSAMALCMGVLENLWQPRFAELTGQESGFLFGMVPAAAFLASALSSLTAPVMTSRLGGERNRTAFLFAICIPGAMAYMSLAHTPFSMAAGFSLAYLLMEGVHVPRKAMLNDMVKPELRATMLSVDSLFSYLGFGCFTVLGLLANKAGIPKVWLLVGGISFPAAWLYSIRKRSVADDGTENPG